MQVVAIPTAQSQFQEGPVPTQALWPLDNLWTFRGAASSPQAKLHEHTGLIVHIQWMLSQL